MPRQYLTSLASRERNRIHARKTRQRKKEQMQNLQGRADQLKEEQMHLKQIINEKTTASILVGLFTRESEDDQSSSEDPRVEELLRRPAGEIPDASKVSELPALILPGQHASKKVKASSVVKLPDDGIDYDLLGKDRSKCTPDELNRIRRERNRMHAKRTRDRKRLFTEQMSEICRVLEEENDLLIAHLSKIDPDHVFTSSVSSRKSCSVSSASTPALNTPEMQPSESPMNGLADADFLDSSLSTLPPRASGSDGHDQICTLLVAASAFDEEKPSRKGSLPELRPTRTTSTPLTSDVLSSVKRNLVALSDGYHSASGGSSSEESSFANTKRQRVTTGSVVLSMRTTHYGGLLKRRQR